MAARSPNPFHPGEHLAAAATPVSPLNAVVDRTPAVMEANLFNLDQKYADAEALTYMERFPLKN